ncbi:MAG: sulfatase-like hydrolase/transferase [Anaerolineales bacterium]|nr:sulfatase-like hydrolase/transferase [Anaerolineales bacterium]
MSKSLNRRDLLKLMAVLPSVYLSRFFQKPSHSYLDSELKNVIIIVFDALSATNISLYGYQRETMPNLARMAEKATVYHRHYAGGNFTTPGTASLLTGTYPWTHRAMRLSSRISRDRRRNNIFNVFDRHYRFAYTHNPIADIHLQDFSDNIDRLKPQSELFLKNNLAFDRLFPKDYDLASVAWERIVNKREDGHSYSLLFSNLYEAYTRGIIKDLSELFPVGVPKASGNDFLLEQSVDWVITQLDDVPRPFLGYFHVLPPHHPYSPRRDYVGRFRDDSVGYLINKPKSIFSEISGDVNLKYQGKERQQYDEFILYADGELGRIYDYLRESKLVDNTWIVFTSDHGEMFERGIFQHRTPVLYEPVIRVPLLIMEPGQQERRDIHTTTSAVDVLPTLLKVTGQEIPDWTEGVVLPPFSETTPLEDRNVYALDATASPEDGTLNPATVMMVKGKYKLTYYYGYEQLENSGPLFELYDLESDPEEMSNLFDSSSEISQDLQRELLDKYKQVNKPHLNS